MDVKIFSTPESFYKAIPKDYKENIEFRKILHTVLDKNQSLQNVFLNLVQKDYKIAFNSMLWTTNPRMPAGQRNLPFILRPKQEVLVDTLVDCIHKQQDVGINKSRDEGATECVTKTLALMAMLENNGYFVVGSRNKDLVDSLGDPYTLFAKIDQVFDTIPPWLRKRVGHVDRKDMQLSIPATGSVVKGETTNESFSAGRRATCIFLDEFGRVEPRIAESIEGSVHDVTGCCIYGSTHWFGSSHPFARALRKQTTTVVNLVWYENPEKAAGLYKTPDYDVIEIIDKDYYVRHYPGIFDGSNDLLDRPFKLSSLEKTLLAKGYNGPSPKFIADKCENLPAGADVRSPWHDAEEQKRQGNFRDFVSNIWASPVGSNDSVFSPITLARVQATTIRPPSFRGEIRFTRASDGHVGGIQVSAGGKGRLQWWGLIRDGRPDLTHAYTIGCDPSLGTGNSNSVAAVLDVNTHEIVGTWVCPNTPYELFADTVTALHHWLGDAYIVFENNGGHGVNFGRRLLANHVRNIYAQRTESAIHKRQSNSWGWHSDTNSKADLLGELGIALSEGLKREPAYLSCVIHDIDILHELRGYVFYENGDIGSEEVQDLTTGARKRHGDRVIAVGLALLGSKYQRQKTIQEVRKVNPFSFEARRRQLEEQELLERRTRRIFRY